MSFTQTNQDCAPDSYHGSARTNSHQWNGVGCHGSGRPHPSRGSQINHSNSGPHLEMLQVIMHLRSQKIMCHILKKNWKSEEPKGGATYAQIPGTSLKTVCLHRW